MFRFTSKCSYTIDSHFLGNEVLLLFSLHFQKYRVFLECFIDMNILQLKIVSLSSIPMLYEVHLVYFEKIPINDYFTNIILIYAKKKWTLHYLRSIQFWGNSISLICHLKQLSKISKYKFISYDLTFVLDNVTMVALVFSHWTKHLTFR